MTTPFLILSIIALFVAAMFVIVIFITIAGREDEKFSQSFYLTIISMVVALVLSVVSFLAYRANLIDKAMVNYELGNYQRKETVINGELVKVRYKLGNVDLD